MAAQEPGVYSRARCARTEEAASSPFNCYHPPGPARLLPVLGQPARGCFQRLGLRTEAVGSAAGRPIVAQGSKRAREEEEAEEGRFDLVPALRAAPYSPPPEPAVAVPADALLRPSELDPQAHSITGVTAGSGADLGEREPTLLQLLGDWWFGRLRYRAASMGPAVTDVSVEADTAPPQPLAPASMLPSSSLPPLSSLPRTPAPRPTLRKIPASTVRSPR
jgi:hypothetical protein